MTGLVRPVGSSPVLAAFLLAAGLCVWPLAGGVSAQEQPADAGGHAAAAQEHGAPGAEHGEADHGGSPWSFVWPLANFVILAGGLWYLLRKPMAHYLEARAGEIKSGLTNAAAMKEQASARILDIEARVKALPGEIERLKARGAEEVEAEQVRIHEAAELERQRLMAQARRDIDLQLQAARRDLTKHAADLAVDLAEKKIERVITTADQQRLVDKYVARLETLHE